MSSIRRAQLTERCDEHEMSWPTSLHRPLNNSAQHFILKLELLASSSQWKQNDTQGFCVEWWGGRMLVVGCFKVRRGCYCTVMWGRGDATCRPTTVTWRGAFKMTWRAFLFLIAYRHLALTTALSLASIKLWNKRACLHRIASEGLAEVISDTCGPQPLYSRHGQPATECRSLTMKTVFGEIKCGMECVLIFLVFLFAIISPPIFYLMCALMALFLVFFYTITSFGLFSCFWYSSHAFFHPSFSFILTTAHLILPVFPFP